MAEPHTAEDRTCSDNDVSAPPVALVWLRRGVPLLFLAFAATAAGRAVQHFDLHAVAHTLRSLDPARLAGVQLLALGGIFAMGLHDWLAARILQLPLPAAKLLRNAWIANSFNNLIGLSGLAGSAIRLLLLSGEKLGTQKAAAFAALILLSLPVGLSVLSWPLLLAAPDSAALALPGWVVRLALGAFALYLPLYVLVLRRALLQRFVRALGPIPGTPLLSLSAISTFDWLLAGVTAWVALEISGAGVDWALFLAAFILASTLGMLSLIPGGLGVFDTALLLLLAPFAAQPTGVISGLLVYRFCYYFVPWCIGLYLGAGRLMATRQLQRVALEKFWRGNRWLGLLRPPLNLLASLGVRVLAYLTFLAGAILLASAAFPALLPRFTLLHKLVPLGIIEISHLLSVATGVLLIAVSRGIAEQYRSAYRLTLALLGAGIAFSLLKGIYYEAAALLAGIAALLRLERKRFYRLDFVLFDPRNLRWLIGLVFAVLAFAWLGDWVHGAIPLGWERLSQFSAADEAPRFARSLLVAALVVLMVLSWALYRRTPLMAAHADAGELAEARALLERHGGSSFAHLLFLGDKRLFWSTARDAFIQYGVVRDRLLALGDPCGNPQVFDALVIEFREYADRLNLTAGFYEVEESGLHRYHDAGFAFLKLGEAALVDLESFSLSGKRGEAVRHAVNRARRGGATFRWLRQPLDAATWDQLEAVSDHWLRTRHGAEKGFSLGTFSREYLSLGDIAAVMLEERIVAFASLMPDYARRRELSVDLMRQNDRAPPGTMEFLFANLIDYAREAGYRYFNLGLAPLSGVGDSRYARAGEKVARLAFEYGNRFYNYKGLRSFKEKFNPLWRGSYLAYPVLTPLPPLLMDIAALIAGGYRYIFFRRR